jgi:hypothetical protein
MSSPGSAYSRFRRALDGGDHVHALSAAAELPHVGIVEALELCLLLLEREPARFGRAAVRWHGRYCRDAAAGLDDAQAVLACLAALPGPRGAEAGRALAELVAQRGLERAGEILNRWAEGGG